MWLSLCCVVLLWVIVWSLFVVVVVVVVVCVLCVWSWLLFVCCVSCVWLLFVMSSSLAPSFCSPRDVLLYLYERATPPVPRNFGPPNADLLPGKPHFALGASHWGAGAFFTGDV